MSQLIHMARVQGEGDRLEITSSMVNNNLAYDVKMADSEMDNYFGAEVIHYVVIQSAAMSVTTGD